MSGKPTMIYAIAAEKKGVTLVKKELEVNSCFYDPDEGWLIEIFVRDDYDQIEEALDELMREGAIYEYWFE